MYACAGYLSAKVTMCFKPLRHELIAERWRCCPWSSQHPLRNMNDKVSGEAALAICSFQPYIGMSCYSYVLLLSSYMIILMQYNICGSNPVYRQRVQQGNSRFPTSSFATRSQSLSLLSSLSSSDARISSFFALVSFCGVRLTFGGVGICALRTKPDKPPPIVR
jgi:hypothetical protein